MKLNAAGKRARARAAATLTADEADQFADLIDAYARSVDRADRLRSAWEKAGCPASSDLIAAMRMNDQTISTLARELRLTPAAARKTGVPGRPAGAASAPDRAAGPPKITRLKAVR